MDNHKLFQIVLINLFALLKIIVIQKNVKKEIQKIFQKNAENRGFGEKIVIAEKGQEYVKNDQTDDEKVIISVNKDVQITNNVGGVQINTTFQKYYVGDKKMGDSNEEDEMKEMKENIDNWKSELIRVNPGMFSQESVSDVFSFIDEGIFVTDGNLEFMFSNIKNIVNNSQNPYNQNGYQTTMFNIDLFDAKVPTKLSIDKFIKNFYDVIQSASHLTIKSVIHIYQLVKDSKEMSNFPYNFKNLERICVKHKKKTDKTSLLSIEDDTSHIKAAVCNESEDEYTDKIYLSDIVCLLKCFQACFWDDKGRFLLEQSKLKSLMKDHSKFYFIYDRISINISFVELNITKRPSVQFVMMNLISKCNMITQDDKNQFKNALLNSIDHEIRTPLNYILINTELLLLEFLSHQKKNMEKLYKSKRHVDIKPDSDNISPTKLKNPIYSQPIKNYECISNNNLSNENGGYGMKSSNENDNQIIKRKAKKRCNTLHPSSGVDYDEVTKKLKHIFDNAKHTHLIIQSLVDFAHMDTEKFSLNLSICNIKNIIDEVLSLYNMQIEQKGIEVIFDIDGKTTLTIAGWRTDEMRLKIIFGNLIHNAIKFTLKGGMIIIHIKLDKSSTQLLIKVTDNGVGIEAKNLRFLLKSLKHPLKNYTNSPTHGIGLGLRCVTSLLRYLGKLDNSDRLDIISTINQETTFAFWLRKIVPNEAIDTYSLISKQNLNNHKNQLENTLVNIISHSDFSTFKKTDGPQQYCGQNHLTVPNHLEMLQSRNFTMNNNKGADIRPNWTKERDYDNVRKSIQILETLKESDATDNSHQPKIPKISQLCSLTENKEDRIIFNNMNNGICPQVDNMINGICPQVDLISNGFNCKCNNIMIVDDEEFNLQILTFQLNHLYDDSLQIYNGNDGMDAVEIFKTKNRTNECKYCMFFKCIISDMNMPVMDGGAACYEICLEIDRIIEKLDNSDVDCRREIKSSEQLYTGGFNCAPMKKMRFPVIIGLTAYTDDDTKKYGLNSGMRLMLNKPTTTVEFGHILKELGLHDNFIPDF